MFEQRNTEYNPFARIYNRHWGAEYRAEVFPVVQGLLLAELSAGATVLDLCCGTGQFTKLVGDCGFDVAGLDASEQMIYFARQNAPSIEFTVADARNFSLKRKFEAIYSVFESLNHVPNIEGLRSAFSCVHDHLLPGGRFLFDLNREEAFKMFWNETNAFVEAGSVCVLRSEYDPETQIGMCKVTEFNLDGGWKRNDFILRQTCHSIDAVQEALLDAGFQNVVLCDARDAGMKKEAGYARTFFISNY